MKNNYWIIKILGGISLAVLILALILILFYNKQERVLLKNNMVLENEKEIILPLPQKTSPVSIEEALLKRRSVRDYKDEPLSLKEISQLLWAAQGITAPEIGAKTAPSAGATYPLEVYLAVRRGEEIKPGVYRYLPENHRLINVKEEDVSDQLTKATMGQVFVGKAPVCLIFSAVFERTTSRYGERGIQYVYMEVGHAAQNVYLQAQSLNLGTVVIGAFDEKKIGEIIKTTEKEIPLYLMPVGKI